MHMLMLATATANPFVELSGDCECQGSTCPCSLYCGHNDICLCLSKDQTCCGRDGDACSANFPECCGSNQCCGGSSGPCVQCTGDECKPWFDDDGENDCTGSGGICGCCPIGINGTMCSNNGACVSNIAPNYEVQCKCDAGTIGNACETECFGNNGQCIDSNNTDPSINVCGNYTDAYRCSTDNTDPFNPCQWICNPFSCTVKTGFAPYKRTCESATTESICDSLNATCNWSPGDVPKPRCVSWRETSDCVGNGTRIPAGDKPCNATIPCHNGLCPSGYCECINGMFHSVTCKVGSHKPFTCEEVCRGY